MTVRIKAATVATLKILSQYEEPFSLETIARDTGGLPQSWRTVLERYSAKSWVTSETRYKDAEMPGRIKGHVSRVRLKVRYFRLTEAGLKVLRERTEVKPKPPTPLSTAPLTDRRHIGSRPILNSVFNLSQFV